MPRHGEPDEGGQLLGLAEIGVGSLGQGLAFERHHALIALGLDAAVDGHGEMTLAEQPPVGGKLGHPLGREARIAAQAARHLIIGDEEIDRSVGRGLEDELALGFERGAEQRGERHRLAEQPRHRFRIIVAREDGIDRRPELDQAPEHLGLLGLEGQDQIVRGDAELDLRLPASARSSPGPARLGVTRLLGLARFGVASS